ncbi:DUF5949 family protein [Streptomyces sp. H51]|uniref:DUF5949 family protein n=1 Tax=Streptomyces sp. H51 TaxID=3111770 RepID=UPI002D780FEB|nr:DUF5949 family protein [Streptomyces sp. H51]
MTTPPRATPSLRTSDLGKIVVMAWNRPTERGTLPYLLACSLGDREHSSAAVEQLLLSTGLTVGGDVVDATRRSDLPVSLLVVPGSAVFTMPHITAQFVPPEGWLAAAEEQGIACLVFTTRPWAGGDPGDYGALAAFANDEETLKSSARVVVPARGLRG